MKTFLQSFFYSFILTLGFIITQHNFNEAKASLDRSENLIREIKQQNEYIKNRFNF